MIVRMLTGIGMDILMSTGATRWTLLINIGWGATLIPALWVATHLDGGRGAAIAQAGIGLLVAMPLAVLALQRAGVRLASVAGRLVRPALAGALAGAVALALRAVAGPSAFVQLSVAGTAGLLVYLATAVPGAELRAWMATIRPKQAHVVPD
jgi:PST family polysaccharide transporter